VEGRVDGRHVAVGSQEFLQGLGVQAPSDGFDDGAIAAGATLTLTFVAVDRKAVGIIFFADSLKPHAQESVKALQAEGVRLVMVTGDRREAAADIAQLLGIQEVEAEVQPQQKAEIVKRLRDQGRIVAMAGDGINDAPALAAADVGIAMGTGTAVAIESAGITLLKGDLRGIVRARRLSRTTIKNIRQNLAFAFLYNTLGIPIAAGIFYPFFHWLLSPMIASAAMSFSSVSVIANALRLRKASL
jgi:Cu+-exporting ATPase